MLMVSPLSTYTSKLQVLLATLPKMKIFGWLQCKLGGTIKEPINGNSCCLSMKPSWKNQQDYLRAKNDSKIKLHTRYEFEDYLSARKAQESVEDASTEETFPGFLAIGTLNMETMVSEPGTPTFGFPADKEEIDDEDNNNNNMEEEAYGLKLINEELEKLYKVESENEWFGESKRTTEEEAKAFHPLEGYLFASSYDCSTTNKTDLSMHVEKNQDELKLAKYKKTTHPMKKLMNALQPTSRKFNKIKQVFRSKVHPEEFKNYNKGKANDGYKCKINPDVYHNATMKVSKKKNDTSEEHWIRSDTDFLVLELGQK